MLNHCSLTRLERFFRRRREEKEKEEKKVSIDGYFPVFVRRINDKHYEILRAGCRVASFPSVSPFRPMTCRHSRIFQQKNTCHF